jgi:hypothetical protein
LAVGRRSVKKSVDDRLRRSVNRFWAFLIWASFFNGSKTQNNFKVYINMVYFLECIWAIWLFATCQQAQPGQPALSRATGPLGNLRQHQSTTRSTTLENQLAHKPFKISTVNQNYSLNLLYLKA